MTQRQETDPNPDELTVESALQRGTAFLRALGIESPRLEMELIAAEALGMDRLGLYLNLKQEMPKDARDASRAMLTRRKLREPLAYILGHKEFYGLRFEVSPAVLIPRPETEILVDRALRWSAERFAEASNRPLLMADIGTGSGAIAVACASEQKRRGVECRWLATDISADALVIAQSNIRRHGLEDRIELREGAFFEAVRDERFDCICSNPPYVPRGDQEALQPEVRNWEPAGALFSGGEGLEHLCRIIEDSNQFLAPRGILLLEAGFGQKKEVERLVNETFHLQWIAAYEDLAGVPRVMEAGRSATEA
ncbi:peptide chain release factor N(5)-glutamine methyltransferase [Candidatus Sumerlaeota bacterium]|nr:peptide chain release factor N(5)-glutamine methyltransferase [Candidatus Sumerlaeota bacterium]